MRLVVTVHSKIKRTISANFTKQVLQKAARHFKRQLIGEVSVIFIDDQKMRALNRTYRGKDKTTNVLSFESGFRFLRPRRMRLGRKVSGFRSVDLGDIFICYPEAIRETKKYNLTLKQELSRLLIHGFLHLMGYDHETERDAKKMERLEQKFLN